MRKLEIQTPRLRLFLPALDEAESALRYFATNKDHLSSTSPILPKDFLTVEFWSERLIDAHEEFEQDRSVRLFFERLENRGEFVGVVNFTQVVRGPFQACYLGYSLDQKSQGQGLMFEALQAGLKFMFEDWSIHRVMANYMPENAKSANVLKRLGFRIDGSSPDYLYIQGAWRTHVLSSLTNTSWSPRAEDLELFS